MSCKQFFIIVSCSSIFFSFSYFCLNRIRKQKETDSEDSAVRFCLCNTTLLLLCDVEIQFVAKLSNSIYFSARHIRTQRKQQKCWNKTRIVRNNSNKLIYFFFYYFNLFLFFCCLSKTKMEIISDAISMENRPLFVWSVIALCCPLLHTWNNQNKKRKKLFFENVSVAVVCSFRLCFLFAHFRLFVHSAWFESRYLKLIFKV